MILSRKLEHRMTLKSIIREGIMIETKSESRMWPHWSPSSSSQVTCARFCFEWNPSLFNDHRNSDSDIWCDRVTCCQQMHLCFLDLFPSGMDEINPIPSILVSFHIHFYLSILTVFYFFLLLLLIDSKY